MWLNSHISHSANVFDSDTAVTQSVILVLSTPADKAQTPYCICIVVTKPMF